MQLKHKILGSLSTFEIFTAKFTGAESYKLYLLKWKLLSITCILSHLKKNPNGYHLLWSHHVYIPEQTRNYIHIKCMRFVMSVRNFFQYLNKL